MTDKKPSNAESIIQTYKALVMKWGLEHEEVESYFTNVMEKELSAEDIAPFIDWSGE